MLPFYLAPEDPPSKQEILKAALSLFAAHGVHATSVRAIAATAGYTNPALFKFFASKEELVNHLFVACYLHQGRQLRRQWEPGAAFDASLRGLLRNFADFVETQPDAFFFVQDNLRALWPQNAARLRGDSLVALVRSFLAEGVKQGRVSGAFPLQLLTTLVMGTLLQWARMRHLGDFQGNRDQWLAQLAQLLTRATAA